MSIKIRQITVSGVPVQVVRKAIKNLHLGVYPPHGRVRVAAPLRVNDAAVRLAVIGKLGWIRRQRARFEAQPRQSRREMVSGDVHNRVNHRALEALTAVRSAIGDGPLACCPAGGGGG